MGKIKTKSKHPPLILPVCLVGANVEGKPNFQAIAWFNMVDYDPYLIGVSSERSHHTNKGIRENRTFSVNVPASGMALATDFCGICSGADVDKSKVFDVFYGELQTAPMINEMPINIECKLNQTIELLHAEFFVGEIVGVYVEERCIVNGKPDLKSIDPLLYEDGLGNYWNLGKYLAKAFEVGKQFKPKKP